MHRLIVVATLVGCSVNSSGTADDFALEDSTTVADGSDGSLNEAAPIFDASDNDTSTVDSTATDSAVIDSTATDSAVTDSGVADATDTPIDAACPKCPPLATCIAGACTCPTNSQICIGKCLDLKADPDRCGSCDLGLPCGLGSMCANSVCACQPGLTLCSGVCVDTKGHVNACGDCSIKCSGSQRCRNGACVDVSGTSCPSTRPTECASDDGRKSCINTDIDPMHCGGCATDKRCASNEFCVSGACKSYAVAVGCTTCPCANCATILSGSRCCPAPPGAPAGRVFCVNASACPSWLP